MKKALTTWSMVLIYAFSVCGGVAAAGCCMDRPTAAEAEHADRQHHHSKAQVSLHAFLHALSLAEYSAIVDHQCCCLASSPGEDVQATHIVRNQRLLPETFAAHHFADYVDSPAFILEFQALSFRLSNGPREHNPTIVSIRSVSLLI